ncbi:MAG: DUF3999 family protein, partial [Verrucomicrobiales bacterium]
VFEPGRHSRVTLDFGEPVRKNTVRVQLSGTNFRRRLALEGSRDNRSWSLISEDQWLFDIHQGGKEFVLNTVSFPLNDFRYLRLSVRYMEDDPRRVDFRKVECALREVVEEKLTPVRVESLAQSIDSETGETVIEADLGFRNLPLGLIGVRIQDDYFYRGVSIRGRNSKVEAIRRETETGWDEVEREAPWRSLHRGVFYRIDKEGAQAERVDAEDLRDAFRFIEIRIDNGDNPPLNVEGIEVARRQASLVFESDGIGPYRLLGGNPQAASPRFDLARATVGLGVRDLPIASVGAITRLEPTELPAPWTERNAALLWIVLAIAVAAMLLPIVKNLRAAGGSGASPE